MPPRWPHFFSDGELVLEVDAGGARLDIGLHDLEAVQRAAEAGLGVGDDRREPVALGAALGMLDLVGALEGAVDPAAQLRAGIGRIERLVGIHGAGGVGVGGDLPARQIDRLQAGADHLHGLVAGDGAERVDRLVVRSAVPTAVGAAAGEAVLDRDRTAQPRAPRRRCRAARCRRSGRSGRGDEIGQDLSSLCSECCSRRKSQNTDGRAPRKKSGVVATM